MITVYQIISATYKHSFADYAMFFNRAQEIFQHEIPLAAQAPLVALLPALESGDIKRLAVDGVTLQAVPISLPEGGSGE